MILAKYTILQNMNYWHLMITDSGDANVVVIFLGGYTKDQILDVLREDFISDEHTKNLLFILLIMLIFHNVPVLLV